MPATEAEYVHQRAELLARLVLTRRKNVQLIPYGGDADAGLDLIARITDPITDLPATPYFGLVVKGTSLSVPDERDAGRLATQAARRSVARWFPLMPVALMLFSMEGDIGYWGWLLEPSVGGPDVPALAHKTRVGMARIDHNSIDGLLSSVTNWFNAVGHVLQHNQQAV